MIIIKKEIDKALNNKNYSKFKQIFQDVSVNSVLLAINEKARLNYLIKGQDLNFLNNIFDFFDQTNDAEKYKYNGMVEFSKTRSTSEHFSFEIEFLPLTINKQKNVVRPSIAYAMQIQSDKTNQITAFKSLAFSKILDNKENANTEFIDQAISVIKKHKLINKKLIRKLGDLALKSNFQEVTNHLINNSFFDKEKQNYYIEYVFQRTSDLNYLDYLMDNFGDDIRKMFFKKIDNNDFWFDFKKSYKEGETGMPSYSHLSYFHKQDKLVWLEKHHMGYSHCELPYFIDFFRELNHKDILNLLEKVNKEKYIEMFEKSIQLYDNLDSNIKSGTPYEKMSKRPQDTLQSLLMNMEYTFRNDEPNLYENLKKIAIKASLEMSLENKVVVKKTNKI